MDKKSTSKSLCKSSVTSTKSNSCESLHCKYRKIKQGRRKLGRLIFNNGDVLYFDSYGLHHLKQKSLTF